MAIESNDLMVLQKAGGGELRKATISALLGQVPAPPAPPTELNDLDDINTSGVADGQMLVYNTDTWVPQDIPEGVDLSNYLQKPGSDGSFVIVENSGAITYSDAIDCGEYAT